MREKATTRPPATLTPTGRAILGMLRFGPRTGYDIKAAIDNAMRFFWAASYGQIYPELKRLEADRLVRTTRSEAGGRRRIEYEITPDGADALHAWLTSDEPLAYELRDEGLLKFFFSDALSPAEALTNVRAMRAHHEGVVRRLREIEPMARDALESGRRHPYLTLIGGIELHEFVADWCRRMEEEVS